MEEKDGWNPNDKSGFLVSVLILAVSIVATVGILIGIVWLTAHFYGFPSYLADWAK